MDKTYSEAHGCSECRQAQTMTLDFKGANPSGDGMTVFRCMECGAVEIHDATLDGFRTYKRVK